jgi:SAM-dependent methyltransferase
VKTRLQPELLLRSYPRKRPEIPKAYEEVYMDAYVNSREGGTLITRLSLWMERWMHRQVAHSPRSFPLLEIGAGTLNHVAFEPGSGRYDIVEPYARLFEGKQYLSRINRIYKDIADVPGNASYLRIISVAVFEHVTDLPTLVARTRHLLEPDGVLRTAIPSEGGLLWYLAWRFGTGLGFWLKYRLSYAPFQRREHVNSADEIEMIIRLNYEDVSIRRFPLKHRHLSFYTFIEAKKPRSSNYSDRLSQ